MCNCTSGNDEITFYKLLLDRIGCPRPRTTIARRLQTQEHLTAQIAAAIDEILKPRGVAVMIEAEHTCMSVRGVAKHGATTFTTRFTGMFRDNPAEQARFLSMARGPQR